MKTRIVPNKTKGYIIPQVSDKFIINNNEFIAVSNPDLDCNRCVFNETQECFLFMCYIKKVSFVPTKIKL